ncbi:FUSC family protein [Flavihumibacter rivuli]|uniref:FUSC family protein n=1 Tax=Flavihumibacter rivuli TaxID=2838156 RepID=UPI001BDF3CA9|nr:FUSC family membrane protein [Flavihumibacter rivuli]ULQ56143.1 FUSC family protein [Flavihumibacter rivuli]
MPYFWAWMIDYIKAFKKFSSSYYLYEGVRLTAGVMTPVLIANYFDQLQTGVAMALGALCVGLTDNAGPIHHRINGMTAAIILVFLTSVITGISLSVPGLLALLIATAGFLFSMVGVYGLRANAVGGAGLLVMVLSIDERASLEEILRNGLFISAGGIWYMILSLTLYRLRPYKLVQQALGDALISTAEYFRMRAGFYETEVDYTRTYNLLMEQQVQVHNKQSLVREMLFKTRAIVKESTHTGRILTMVFLDSVDLLERIMTSQQDYRVLHEQLDESGLLQNARDLILRLANDTEEIGLALQEGRRSRPDTGITEAIQSLRQQFQERREKVMNETNLEAFISLRHILDSIQDLHGRITTLHRYTSFDKQVGDTFSRQVDYNKFVSPSDFNLKLFITNLSIDSNIFRHTIRVSLSLLAGFFLSRLLNVGHGYWILLTIIVILKPAYSLTKQRNIERLSGTFIGAVAGALILYFIKDDRVLVGLMIMGMIIAYSLIRVQYLLCVIGMTVYILIAFHFLKPGDFTEVLRDRLLDTLAGSAIAFIATFAIPPKWEQEQIMDLLKNTIRANATYFRFITRPFLGETLSNTEYKLHRKEALVSLANLSDAFQRMLNEPRRYQKKAQVLHQLVVSNHVLASHIATLSSYRKLAEAYKSENFRPIINASLLHMDTAAQYLDEGKGKITPADNEANFVIREELKLLLEQRSRELASGALETNTRQRLSDLKTIADQFEYINLLSIELEKLTAKLDID